MNRKLLPYSLLFLLLTFVVATALRREVTRPQTPLSRPRAALSQETHAAGQTQQASRPPVGVAGDERKRTTLEVAKLSSRAVVARCRAVDVREVAGGNIFTFYEFDTLATLKGEEAGDGFTLRILGGRVGNAEITPALNVEFVPGQKYVLFLGRENAEGYPTISSQSVFQVRVSPLDRSEVVTPSPAGLPIYNARSGRKYDETPDLLSLEDFLFSVRKQVE
jgi:hypothetical protein